MTEPLDNPTLSHVNNFDFLRILFATLVLITHSYPLTGVPEQDVLWHFSHGQLLLSKLGVAGFFVISGYLILKSLLRSKSLKEYYFKRIIRLFPALWVVVLLTLLGGYFLAGKSAAAYFTDHSTLKYLLNLVLRMHLGIEGVFEHNPYPSFINASLWTIPYEVLCYLLLTPLFFIRQRGPLVRAALIGAFVVLLGLQGAGLVKFPTPGLRLDSDQIIFFGLFFLSGAVLALFPAWLRAARTRNLLVGLSGLGLLGTLYFGGFALAQFLLVPVFVIALGASNYPALSWIRRYGDISYGVYIWGFPVQQTLWYFLHPSQPVMALLSIPITWALGFLSWHFIEEPVLRLKLQAPVAQLA